MKKLRIVALIARNHKDIRESRAARIGKSLKMSQEALLENIQIVANNGIEIFQQRRYLLMSSFV